MAAGLPRAGTHCAPGRRGARPRPLVAVPGAAAAARRAPPRPGRRGPRRGRGRGGGRGGVSGGGPNGGSRGAGATWRRECCTPAERPRPAASYGGPPPAASGPCSGEQRRPFGEGPPRGGGRGVPGAGLRPAWPRSLLPRGRAAGAAGPQAEVSGVGVGGRLVGVRAPSPRAQGHGGDGAAPGPRTPAVRARPAAWTRHDPPRLPDGGRAAPAAGPAGGRPVPAGRPEAAAPRSLGSAAANVRHSYRSAVSKHTPPSRGAHRGEESEGVSVLGII